MFLINKINKNECELPKEMITKMFVLRTNGICHKYSIKEVKCNNN